MQQQACGARTWTQPQNRGGRCEREHEYECDSATVTIYWNTYSDCASWDGSGGGLVHFYDVVLPLYSHLGTCGSCVTARDLGG
jgi:hypothetical protein